MKLFLTALAGVLAFTLTTPSAQAKDKHKKHHDDHRRNYRYQSDHRVIYERSYGSSPYYYYQGRRHFSYYRDPDAGNRYYYPRPGINLYFGR